MKFVPSQCGKAARSAFTLVELLVVIGIIALLISILLPALNTARNSAKSVMCLSNLRQLSIACAMYTSQNGYTVPAWIYGPSASKVKLTPENVNGADLYLPGPDIPYFQSWPVILYNAKLISTPTASSKFDPPVNKGVFYCPMGTQDFLADGLLNEVVGKNWDEAKWRAHDVLPGFGTAYRYSGRDSATGPVTMIDSWYGINSSDQPGTGFSNNPTWANAPTRTMQDSDMAKPRSAYLVRASTIRESSKVAFLFDGVYTVPSRDAGRINGRHGKNRLYTNVGFVDGHAETIPRFDMPWLATSPYGPSNQFQYSKLVDFPRVHWRTDGR